MAEPQYKISGLYYTKPIVRYDGNGVMQSARTGVYLTVGELDNFGVGMKKIDRIEYDNDLNAFRVYFFKGGLKVIPHSPEVEVYYEEINTKTNGKL
jgi:hypothetical protein